MFRKILVISLLLSGYSLSAKVPEGTLKVLVQERRRCQSYSKHKGLEYHQKVLTCKGTVVYHERQEKKRFRFDRDILTTNGRLDSVALGYEKNKKTLQTHLIKTSEITFYKAKTPINGIKLSFSSCEAINLENIQRLCTREIQDYCQNNNYDPGKSSSETKELCAVEKLSTIDFSKLFPEL